MAETLASPEAIDRWIREHWLFVPDPIEYEYVKTPALQLADAASNGGILTGDCDDAATLAASLLLAISWPCRLVAIRRRPDPEFSHVFVRTPMFEYAGASEMQLDIDPIVPAEQLPLQGDFELMVLNI